MKNGEMDFFPRRIFVVESVLYLFLLYEDEMRRCLVNNPIEVEGEFLKIEVGISFILRGDIGKFTFPVTMHLGVALILAKGFYKSLIVKNIIGKIHSCPQIGIKHGKDDEQNTYVNSFFHQRQR